MRTRVKICGVTRPEDAAMAADLGADAVGLNFWPPGSRCIDADRAGEIVSVLPPMVTPVGVFVDPEQRQVEGVLARAALSVLQFHGDESPSECERYGLPYIKVIRVRGGEDWTEIEARYAGARALLLDSYRRNVPGGTGAVFDWSLAPAERAKPLVLAGGLRVDNVAQAVQTVRPYAVDVCGGVEESPGRKSPALVGAFIREVFDANSRERAG